MIDETINVKESTKERNPFWFYGLTIFWFDLIVHSPGIVMDRLIVKNVRYNKKKWNLQEKDNIKTYDLWLLMACHIMASRFAWFSIHHLKSSLDNFFKMTISHTCPTLIINKISIFFLISR